MWTEEEQEAAKIRRARHQTLHGYLQDAHRTLMQPGMVSMADLEVQKQIHSLHDFEDDPASMLPPPVGLDEEEQYEFEIGSTMVTARDGSPMSVPALAWVMDHLLKSHGGASDPKLAPLRSLPKLFQHAI